MLHRACRQALDALQTQNSSLHALVVDLQNRYDTLLETMVEERRQAAERERDLSDRFLAIASPLAAQMIGVGRSPSPASPMPAVSLSADQRAGRDNVRPLLKPQPRRYRSVAEMIEEQRRKQEKKPQPEPQPTTEAGTEDAASVQAEDQQENQDPDAATVTYPPA